MSRRSLVRTSLCSHCPLLTSRCSYIWSLPSQPCLSDSLSLPLASVSLPFLLEDCGEWRGMMRGKVRSYSILSIF